MQTFPRVFGKLALVVAGAGVLAAIFLYSGIYNVAATTGHAKPVEKIFRILMMRSVVVRARSLTLPANFDPRAPGLAQQAAGHYELMCRTCHGAPGRKPDPWQLYPPAPDLADALRVMRWTDTEVFWIIKNGIKDTGMSAFGESHDDDDLWALTAFVRQIQSMTPEQYRVMSGHDRAKGVESGDHGAAAMEQKSGPPKQSEPAHKH